MGYFQALNALSSILSREGDIYFTHNVYHYKRTTEIWYEHYKLVRLSGGDYNPGHGHPISTHPDTIASLQVTALRALRDLGYRSITAIDFRKMLPTDPYDDELHLMAEVRAFFQVAFEVKLLLTMFHVVRLSHTILFVQRFVDAVPTMIQHDFVQRFADGLQEHLIQKLDMDGQDAGQRFASWLEEDPKIGQERERLTKQLQQLREFRRRLENCVF